MGIESGPRWDIGKGEVGYPPALKELARPPEELHGRGDPDALGLPCVGVIGSRKPTPYGVAVARMAGRVAAECGVCVVSGGAMGCDSEAARACLSAGGKTIVVSGCGADVVYPASSADVYEGAIASGGAVVSAERWGAGPRRWAFPRRNGMIAALGASLIVTEGGASSGTLGTADAALELGRRVYAVPGSIFSPLSRGTNSLACEGATIIPDEQSLALAISMDFGCLAREDARQGFEPGPVMAALVANPMRPDDLAASLGEDVITVLRTLTEYEAKGVAVRLADGRYSPSESYLLGKMR